MEYLSEGRKALKIMRERVDSDKTKKNRFAYTDFNAITFIFLQTITADNDEIAGDNIITWAKLNCTKQKNITIEGKNPKMASSLKERPTFPLQHTKIEEDDNSDY